MLIERCPHEVCHVHLLIREHARLTDDRPRLGAVSDFYLVGLRSMIRLYHHQADRVPATGFDLTDDGGRFARHPDGEPRGQ